MTQQQKLIREKMSLLELAEYLKNVSRACRVMERNYISPNTYRSFIKGITIIHHIANNTLRKLDQKTIFNGLVTNFTSCGEALSM